MPYTVGAMTSFKWEVRRIYATAALCCLLLGAAQYLFVFRPMAEQLHQAQGAKVSELRRNGARLIEAVVARHRNLAEQSASRSAIRERLVEYLHGALDFQALVDYSVPKLADAARASDEIRGIIRFDANGRRLYAVGEDLPVPADMQLLGPAQKVRMRGPIFGPGGPRLLYYAPIIDPREGFVGTDVLSVEDTAIRRAMNEGRLRFGHLALVQNGEIDYATPGAEARAALTRRLSGGDGDGDYLLEAQRLEDTPWTLYALVERAELLAPVNRQVRSLLGWLAAVTLMAAAACLLALHALMNRLLQPKRLYQFSRTEPLTGLANREHLYAELERELHRIQRSGRPLSLLLVDADHFRRIHERYGPRQGERVLRQLARALSAVVHEPDCLAYCGADQFAVLLPETDDEAARLTAERLRRHISRERLRIGAETLTLTVSIGVATARPGEIGPPARLVEAAHNALAAGRREGRDRVSVAGETGPRIEDPAGRRVEPKDRRSRR